MADSEKTSEEDQQGATEEVTTPSASSLSKVETPQPEDLPTTTSTSHEEDNPKSPVASEPQNSENIDSTSEEKTEAAPITSSETPTLEQTLSQDEIEVTQEESSADAPDGRDEKQQDETTAEITEIPESQPNDSEQDDASPPARAPTEEIDDEQGMTVTLNIDIDGVVSSVVPSVKETGSADEQSLRSLPEKEPETSSEVPSSQPDGQPGSADPVSPNPSKDDDKETMDGNGSEHPPVEDLASVSDRQFSIDGSTIHTSEPTTPSKPGTPETGISIPTRGEAPNAQSRFTTPHPPSRQVLERPLTRDSASTEFMYDEAKDFKTPDYEYSQTPLYSVRGDSGVRKTVSRGDSTKSVTFADDLMGRRSVKDHGVEEEEEEEEQGSSSDEEAGEKGEKEEDKEEEEEEETDKGKEDDDEVKGNQTPSDESVKNDTEADLFPTAVSEEKIEEAKLKQKERMASEAAAREQRLMGLFGAPKLDDRRTMEDVIGSKAREHFDKGCVLLSEQEYSQAIVCFDKAINLCPKEVRYYLMRAEAYLQMCDFQSAILNLKKACVLDPDNDTYYTRLAFVYYFQGQTLFDQCLYAEALESFSRASEMRPEVVGYHTRSVACLAALQRHGECLALVNKRLEVEQNNPDLYIMRARLHELFRNTSLCFYDLKDAIALDPSRAEANALMKELEAKAEDSRNHAIRLQLQGKLKEAMHKITDAVETNPAVADYHLLRGALHRRLHDYNAAIDDFLLALDKTDHNEQNRVYMESQRQLLLTYNDFAVECFLGSHFEEAIILLNKAIKGEKREKGLYINRGDCFFRLNELHFSLADYHQALEIDSSDWLIRSRIASIHSEFGLLDYEEHSYKEAEARFTVAIQHNPRVGSYYIWRAKVRYMLENHAGARHDLLVTLHLEPNNEEILTLLPRLFPGKPISEIMKSKAARTAKAEVDNAVVTASPVRLPSLNGEAAGKVEGLPAASEIKNQRSAAKTVAFASGAAAPPESVMPDLKVCMDEISFNTVLAKKKKKVSTHVKSLLHDRQSLWTDAPKLCPQPPARPYAIRGGNPNKNQSNIDPSMGWRSFSVGVEQK